MPYIEFQANIWSAFQRDTTPADLASVVPGAGGYVPGNADLLKSIVGFLIVECGWSLVAKNGADPSSYVLSSTGITGYDKVAIEIAWDTNRANLLTRMGYGVTGTSLTSPSPWITWPVSNGASTAVNDPRIVTVYMFGNKNGFSLVTREDNSAYCSGIGPFGILDRLSSMIPAGAAEANKDYTAIFMALPTRILAFTSADATLRAYVQKLYAGLTNETWPGSTNLSKSYISMPLANFGLTSYAYLNSYTGYFSVQNAILVFQNYGDVSVSWVANFLSNGGSIDSGYSMNFSLQSETVATYSTNVRCPAMKRPGIGTDGMFHLEKELVFQMLNNTDPNPRVRGTLPYVLDLGWSGSGEYSEVIAGGETYKRLFVNAGFWPRTNPYGFALRKA